MTLASLLCAGILMAAGSGEDTTRTRPDSLLRFSTLPLVGSIDRLLPAERTIAGDAFPRLDVRFLGDALALFPGTYLRDQQSPGQYSQLNVRGVDARGVVLLLDGRPLNDPAGGTANLYLFPPENVERVELVAGPEAFLYGRNATGAAVNLVTRDFDSNIPRTRLHLSVSSYSFEASDASFHQNVTRRLNVSFGLRAQNTDGRFSNSALNAWNLRAKVRYHLLPRLSLHVSEHYTSTRTGLFSGVDPSRTDPSEVFSPLVATVVHPNAYEKLTRHDLTATLAGSFSADTTAATRLTLFYSNSLREYRDGDAGASGLLETVKDDHRTSWLGGILTQEFTLGPQRVTAAVGLEEHRIEASTFLGGRRMPIATARVTDRIRLAPAAELSVFARAERSPGKSALGAGTTLRLNASEWLTITAGISRSHRSPNAVELFWSDSTVSRPAEPVREIHTVAEAGVVLETSIGALHLTFFRRQVDHPILLEPFGTDGLRVVNGERATAAGIDLGAALRFWYLTLEGNGAVTVFTPETARDRYPWLHARGGLYFEYPLFDGHLDIKAGVRGSGQVGQRGELFDARRLIYRRNVGTAPGAGARIDLALLARIGSADLHLIWENVTDARYYSSPYFPVMDRVVRFGVAWSFIN